MIKTLSLRYFRKHEDLHLDFTSGLNVLRGANEAGKSTVQEACLYALYGSKALRSPLSETVTWDHKDTQLKVELVITVGEIDYTFTRSKAGAECNYHTSGQDAFKIVGQNEVSAFAAQLLGADAKTATLLMMAGQNDLRGALNDGPTAVSGLMARLADFDLVDRIVEAAQAKLLLGADAPIKSKLDAARETLDKATAEAPDMQVWADLDQQRAAKAEKIGRLEADLAVAAPAFQKAEQELQAALTNNDALDALERSVATLQSSRATAASNLDRSMILAKRVPPQQIKDAQEAVEQARKHDETAKAYALVTGLPPFPAVFWDQPMESFEAELDRVRSQISALYMKMSEEQREIQHLRSKIIKDGKCPLCGHDAGNDEHVQKQNAELEAQAQALAQALAKSEAEHTALVNDSNALADIKRMAARFDSVRASVQGKGYPVEIDTSTVPCRITWKTVEPRRADLKALQGALADLELKDQAAVRAEGQVQVYRKQLDEIDNQILTVQADIAKGKRVDTTELIQTYNLWASRTVELEQGLENAKIERDELQRQYDIAKAQWDESQRTIETAKARIAEYEQDLKTLAFNNALIKKLRGLKPVITDHLWSSVLAAVSNFFSELRGEKSVVTKEASGFRVNGQSIESLSGSTLDVLALAVRVALTKTFIPYASFMTLDEPASGCDIARTSAMLGFLASIGFTQTILASHDELSESVADNIIALES